jgi:hypothetical protein
MFQVIVSFIFVSIACGAQPAGAVQVDPANPRAVIEFLLMHEVGWPGDYDHLYERIRREPEKYAPLIAEVLEVPDRIEDWRPMPPDVPGQSFSRHIAVGGHGLIPLLGRQHADPILNKYFKNGYRLYTQALAREKSLLEMEEGEVAADARQAELGRVWQQRDSAMGMMTMAVVQATAIKSPVVVDPMLAFWEAGHNDRQGGLPHYPLMFAHERPDVIPRLKAIMENPATDSMVKHQVRRALEWYAKTLAQAEAADPMLAEAPPRPDLPPTIEEPPQPK